MKRNSAGTKANILQFTFLITHFNLFTFMITYEQSHLKFLTNFIKSFSSINQLIHYGTQINYTTEYQLSGSFTFEEKK